MKKHSTQQSTGVAIYDLENGSLKELRRFRKLLLSWYQRAGRPLPWRATRDPYLIWISEIMLQQTTVTAVVPYFERFIQRFPNLKSLAASDESDVLRFWEGLGYYSRARNLHRAAQTLVSSHAEQFPRSVDELQNLPGIGRYTAGAIASFAFNLKAPIVEANTLRLYSRLLGLEDDPRSAVGQKRLWSFAEQLLPEFEAGETNQALMELGSRLCRPKDPECDACPVMSYCQANRENRQDEIPLRAKRIDVTKITHLSAAVCRNGMYLLRQWQPHERWAGLWDFPRFEWNGESNPCEEQFLSDRLEEMIGGAVIVQGPLADWYHSVTRYRIHLRCFRAKTSAKVGSTRGVPSGSNSLTSHIRRGNSVAFQWASPESFDEIPLTVTGRKIANKVKGLAK